MLKKLSIRNFVLIDEAEIHFSSGLNILSGETGGGKSVIATAIGLFAGGRARPEYIRKGFDKAVIEGEFEIDDRKGGRVIVRRDFDRRGRSRCNYDGSVVGTGRLKDELGKLLCITSQHEQVNLTSVDVHRSMLDEFGSVAEALEKYRRIYADWRTTKEKVREMTQKISERESRIDYLKHQVEEIKRAALKPGEDEEIRSRLSMIKDRSRISEALKYSIHELFDSDMGAATKVAKTSREIDKVAGSLASLADASRILEDVQALLGELERSMNSTMGELDFDGDSVDAIQERLYEVERLKKKYRGGIKDILGGLAVMEEELAFLENLDSNLQEWSEKQEKLEQKLTAGADRISRMRKKAAGRLKEAMMGQLADLAFKNVNFDVDIRSRRDVAGSAQLEDWLDESGGDEVEFLLQPNEGEDFAPLRRIASGGELSRVLLALKVALRSGGKGETFIFDEIDSGIGGAGAEAVGRKLHLLGKYNQVLCITHLPQIATYGDKHMLVGKRVRKGRTLTYITDLERGGRIEELARMLGGEKITKKGRDAASEMLSSAEKFKSTE